MLLSLVSAALVLGQLSPWVVTLGRQIDSGKLDGAEEGIRATVKAEDLKNGLTHKGFTAYSSDDVIQLFVIDPGAGDHTGRVVGDNMEPVPLTRVGNLLAKVVTLKSGFGSKLHYEIDGVEKPSFDYEVYRPHALQSELGQPLQGKLLDLGQLASKVYPGTTRKLFVYLPPDLDPSKEYPVLFGTDAQWDRDWQAHYLEVCATKGMIPPTVGVFTEAGQLAEGDGYKHRSPEYDTLSPAYTQFLLTEVEPQVSKLVKLSQDSKQRACTGVSSGGICGFTACWERPDKFGVVISAVGSFADIAHGDDLKQGGHNYPFLIRQTEKKPIRVFLQDGSHDLDNQFGNWFLCNQQLAAALKFKGYDYVFHSGQGFHSSEHMRSIFDQALVWWNGIKK